MPEILNSVPTTAAKHPAGEPGDIAFGKAHKPKAKAVKPKKPAEKAKQPEPKAAKTGFKGRALRILSALAKAGDKGLSTLGVSEKSGVDKAWIGDFLGRVDPEVRAKREEKLGRKTFLTLKLVSTKLIDVDGRDERRWFITAAGKKAAIQ